MEPRRQTNANSLSQTGRDANPRGLLAAYQRGHHSPSNTRHHYRSQDHQIDMAKITLFRARLSMLVYIQIAKLDTASVVHADRIRFNQSSPLDH